LKAFTSSNRASLEAVSVDGDLVDFQVGLHPELDVEPLEGAERELGESFRGEGPVS
jgi:hypothetical protein